MLKCKVLIEAAIAALLASALVSCHDGMGRGNVNIRVEFPSCVKSAVSDDALTDVTFFLCDENDIVLDVYGCGGDELLVPLEYGVPYHVHALVNTGGMGLSVPPGTALGDVVLEDMSACVFRNVMAGGVPVLVWDYRDVVTVPVHAVMARLDIVADKASLPHGVDYVVENVSLCQCCAATTPFTPVEISPVGGVFDATGIPSGLLSLLNEGVPISLFVPENRRGVVPGISSPWQKTPEYLSTACSAPEVAAKATYMEISTVFIDSRSDAAGVRKKVLFRFFLGENALDDFNLTRGRAYSIVFSPSVETTGYSGNWKVWSSACDAAVAMEGLDDVYLRIDY